MEEIKQKQAEQVRAALAREFKAAMKKPCVVCGMPSTSAMTWTPTQEHLARHGGNIRQIRTYVFGVCDKHDPNQMHLFESKDQAMKRIDAAIIKGLSDD